MSFFKCSSDSCSASSAGGKKGEWNILEKLSQIIEKQNPVLVGKGLGELKSEYVNPYGQNPFRVDLEKISSFHQLLMEIRKYAETQTSLSENTIKRDIRRIKLMANKNQPFPIDFLNPSNPQFNYHMSWYRENKYDDKTGRNFYGLKERREAFYLYLESVGIPKNYFPYRLPKQPQNNTVDFPNPDKAVEITRSSFYNDKELDWYWQFAHLYNFIVGPRAPSEIIVMQISDIDFDNCTIKFRQPKLNNKIRKIELPEAFIKGKTRKSLKNFIDYHRSKFVNQYSDDYLFISPWSGKPYGPDGLAKRLASTGKQVMSDFHCYMGRHFCATGKLISYYLEKHPDPLKATKHFMGHESIKNTEKYTELSEFYFKKYPFNWFKRILKDSSSIRWSNRGKCDIKPKQEQKANVSIENPSREESNLGRGYWLFIEVILIETTAETLGFGFLFIFLKPSGVLF